MPYFLQQSPLQHPAGQQSALTAAKAGTVAPSTAANRTISIAFFMTFSSADGLMPSAINRVCKDGEEWKRGEECF